MFHGVNSHRVELIGLITKAVKRTPSKQLEISMEIPVMMVPNAVPEVGCYVQ